MNALHLNTHAVVWRLEQSSEMPSRVHELVIGIPDRILAATVLALGVPLVTCDEKIRAFDAIETIW